MKNIVYIALIIAMLFVTDTVATRSILRKNKPDKESSDRSDKLMDKARDFIPDWNSDGYSNLPGLFKSLGNNTLVVPQTERDDTDTHKKRTKTKRSKSKQRGI